MSTADTGNKPSPLVVAGLIAVAIVAVVAVFWSAMRPRTMTPNEVANTVKDIQAPPGTPLVPREKIQADVMSRGFKKNTGKGGPP